MGLQNQLSDVSSESFLILTVVLVGKSVRYLHSLLFSILGVFSSSSFSSSCHRVDVSSLYDVVVGSRLADVVLLCEQLNLNLRCSSTARSEVVVDSDCVVCLNRLREGERVRRLTCRHVFHKDCLDGWLDQLNFSCPLCRAPLVSDERVACTRRRISGDLLAWFPIR